MVASWSIELVNKLFVTSWMISSVLIEWGSSSFILRRAWPIVAMAHLVSSSSFYSYCTFQCCHCCGGVLTSSFARACSIVVRWLSTKMR